MAETNPQSRVEAILGSMAGSYSGELPKPQSRVEELLLAIHDEGGTGGTNDYNKLINKPSLNGTTLQGDLTSEDVHVPSKQTGQDTTWNPDTESVVIGGGGGSGNTYNPDDEHIVIGG